MSVSPRVSVLLPAYNADARFFRAAVASIVAQTFGDWELIVIEEPPAGCVREVLAHFEDPRILHVVRTERTHLADSLNEGLGLCRGELIARMDADDVMDPDRLRRQVVFLDGHPEVTVAGSAIVVINENDEVIGRRAMPADADAVAAAMRRYNAVTHPAVMFRRAAIAAAGGYARVRAEDYDLWCRLIVQGARIANLPEPLLRYRYHQKSVKFGTVHEMIRETIATKVRHFSGRLTTADRLRILAERALLVLPPRLVLWLFRRLAY